MRDRKVIAKLLCPCQPNSSVDSILIQQILGRCAPSAYRTTLTKHICLSNYLHVCCEVSKYSVTGTGIESSVDTILIMTDLYINHCSPNAYHITLTKRNKETKRKKKKSFSSKHLHVYCKVSESNVPGTDWKAFISLSAILFQLTAF